MTEEINTSLLLQLVEGEVSWHHLDHITLNMNLQEKQNIGINNTLWYFGGDEKVPLVTFLA